MNKTYLFFRPWSCLAAFLLLAFSLSAATSPSPVVISEFLASNNTGFVDEDGDASDWVELVNIGPTNVNLNGWYLTDDPDNLTRWRFPATNLPPAGFLVVFA